MALSITAARFPFALTRPARALAAFLSWRTFAARRCVDAKTRPEAVIIRRILSPLVAFVLIIDQFIRRSRLVIGRHFSLV